MVDPMATVSRSISAITRIGKDPCYSALPPHATMTEAVSGMLRMNQSAVTVMVGNQLIGLVTRTDILKALDPTRQRVSGHLPLSGVMTTDLVVAAPEDTFQHALERMAQSNIEHLPVVDKHGLVTVLQQRELLLHQMNALNADINHLQEYIEGLHHAGQD